MNALTQIKRFAMTALFAGTLCLASGCRLFVVGAAVGAGARTVAYIDGKVEASYGYPYDQVVAAPEKAISQLGFAQPEEQKDSLTDTFTTSDAKGDSIKIVVTRSSDTATKVTIRVGTFSDRELSMAINDKIKSNL